MRKTTRVTIEGTELELSNLDKVLYPAAGFTKGEVIDYYLEIGPYILPHLKDRPLTMKRFPNGVKAEYFYEKRCPVFHPEWVPTSHVEGEGHREVVDYCMINSLPALIWVANLASLELHPLLFRSKDITRPTMLVFDLDPGEGADIFAAARAAFWLKAALAEASLVSFIKTSGKKGLHLQVPLNTPVTFAETKSFAQSVALRLEAEHPDAITSNMRKIARAGKIFIDWSQNDHHKTTVCVYSLRAEDHPTVSTPISWEELQAAEKSKDLARLTFEAGDMKIRLKKLGDLFSPLLTLRQKLPRSKA
jgi:bifunctional non-homologous end joining protein LigD